MLGWVRDFYRRHRRKLFMTGVIVGGTYIAGKYVSYKIEEWTKVKVEEMQKDARRKFHFESNQKSCTSTFISFLPNVRNIIVDKLNTEHLLEVLKLKPDNKLEIWNQLKILSLTQMLCSVVASVTLLVVLKVKMNVIGAYAFATAESLSIVTDNNNQVDTGTDTTAPAVSEDPDDLSTFQVRYLNNVRYFVEEKLPDLIEDCHEVVQQLLSKVSLKEKLSHDRLKQICSDALMKVKAKHTSLDSNKHEFCVYTVNPAWMETEENNEAYSHIVSETVNILESIDCSLVLDNCLIAGMEQVLGSFKDSFKSCKAPSPTLTLESCINVDLTSGELAMAKIIPILNSQVHNIFKAGTNEFLDVLFSQDLIRELSRAAYDSGVKEFS